MKKCTSTMYLFWFVMLVFNYTDIYFLGSRYEVIYFASTALITVFLVFSWFLSDAGENDVIPSTGLKLGVIVIPFITIPYYLLKYKGLKRSCISIVKFVAFLMAVMGVVYLISELGISV